MKKIILMAMFVTILFALISCTQKESGDFNNPVESIYEGNSKDGDETHTVCETMNPSNEEVENKDTQSSPVIITFEKIEDISYLISAGLGTYEEYVKYSQEKTPDVLISQEDLNMAAKVISAFSIPTAENSDQVEYLGGNYYMERAELNLYYKVNGERYCFTYEYGKKAPYKYDGVLVIENAMLGAEKIDIYKVEGGFIGSTVDKVGIVSVRIYSNDKSSVSFENFDFVPFSEIVVE